MSNLRLKAKALKLNAQDYLTDKVKQEAVENIQKEVFKNFRNSSSHN